MRHIKYVRMYICMCNIYILVFIFIYAVQIHNALHIVPFKFAIKYKNKNEIYSLSWSSVQCSTNCVCVCVIVYANAIWCKNLNYMECEWQVANKKIVKSYTCRVRIQNISDAYKAHKTITTAKNANRKYFIFISIRIGIVLHKYWIVMMTIYSFFFGRNIIKPIYCVLYTKVYENYLSGFFLDEINIQIGVLGLLKQKMITTELDQSAIIMN